MTIQLKVPTLGESILEVRIGHWLKQEGQWVAKDEDLVEIESEKATVTLPAPEAGRLAKISVPSGEDAKVGQVIGELEKGDPPPVRSDQAEKHQKEQSAKTDDDSKSSTTSHDNDVLPTAGPDARRALREFGLRGEQIAHDAKGRRLTRRDVEQYAKDHTSGDSEPAAAVSALAGTAEGAKESREEIVPMSLLRRRIAERLVQAQAQAALLTTFNEIDMSAVIGLRTRYGESFQKKYEARLGFMSFFVKAAVEALKEFPAVNAEVRGTNIAYRNYYDIGIAVSTDRGLVVPVLRDANRLGLADIETHLAAAALRARQGQLTPDELRGGTFSITNGGVFGSLLSTPIVNPPQSGILGLHAIQDRPIAVAGQVVIRPMMYTALTYDHRLVDGREAVLFLKRIKELIEDPARMLLEA